MLLFIFVIQCRFLLYEIHNIIINTYYIINHTFRNTQKINKYISEKLLLNMLQANPLFKKSLITQT